ncbi:M48 family metalloprotease [Thioalkalicoccus limnaeus]|uniref:M48 family metalloprotease n=1 Tax=Thioalkalicoccus limnaeus TaxID=120681 RepID=UPI0034E97985
MKSSLITWFFVSALAGASLIGAVPTAISADVGSPRLNLPDFGSSADTLLSSGEERRLGQAFMHSVRRALPVIEDPLLSDYVAGFGQRLVAASGHRGRHFHFFLIDDPLVNAFAGPHGYIGIYAGLVLAAETESELAAVIAHEIAHVTQRHLMRAIEDARKMSLPATALLIGAAILGARVSPDAGTAAMAGIQAATIQRQISFTRENEKEADRIGIATLADAGHDPFAMAGFFDRLAKGSRIHETNAPEMLRTHPVTTSRIADAVARAEAFGHRQRPDSLRFHLVRANLRERGYRRPEQAVEHFRATLREGRYANETAERYGYALALARHGQIDAARKQIAPLLASHPQQAEFLILDAELARRAGNTDRALTSLREAVGLSPSSLPLRMAYAEALLEAGQGRSALRQLEPLAQGQEAGPALFALLVTAAARAQDQGATYRYRAEQHYARGDIDAAIRQLEAAVRQRDLAYHEAARLQARLDELNDENEAIKQDPWNR